MSKITKAIAALGVVAGLGVAALPLSSFAVESGPVKVTAVVDNTISVTANDAEVNLGTVMPNGPVSTASTSVNVATTNETGYTLVVKDADERTGLYKANADGSLNTTTGKFIEAGVPAKGTTAWGVRADAAAAYQGVTAYSGAGVQLKKTAASATTGGDNTTVEFGVSVATGFESGTYTGEVVFVATANPAAGA